MVFVAPGHAEDAMRAALRARMALLRLHTASSSDRTLAVSGPQAGLNAYLLEAVQQQRVALEQLLRVPVPWGRQRIRLQVLPSDGDGAVAAGISLRTETVLGDVIHRITLPDYESAHVQAAHEALILALLSVYVIHENDGNILRPPSWFWQGVVEVLHADDVKITLEYVDRLWRAGHVPSLGLFLRRSQEGRLDPEDAMFAGAVVYWLVTRPSSARIVRHVFRAFAAQEEVDVHWLQSYVGPDPDEQLDRWLLAQRRIVRGVGVVMQFHIDDLQELLLLYPGQHGIPRNAAITWGAPLAELGAHRKNVWFAEAINHRRNALQFVAQGRPERFRAVVDGFLDVLDGVVAGEDQEKLEAQEQRALLALRLFAGEVEEHGGIWREE